MGEGNGKSLEIRVGLRSERGPREHNEDYCGVYLGTAAERARLGIVAVVADGVGGSKGGRQAAETAVRAFIDGYLNLSDKSTPLRAAALSLASINQWIRAIGSRDADLEAMSCTFTAAILRGRRLYVAHIGDTRLYRFRDDVSTLLTHDHVLSGAGRSHHLTRCLGASETIQIDCALEDIRPHDRLLLCCDGIHGVLSSRRIAAELSRRESPEETADRLVDAAVGARSGDNMTALVIDIIAVPAADMNDLQLTAEQLPIVPVPKPGTKVDVYRLENIVADGRYSRVFRALDESDGRPVIVKFPKPLLDKDGPLRQAFVRESWIMSRVRSPYVGEGKPLDAEHSTCLYTVMPFYEGDTLEQRLSSPRSLSLTAGLGIAVKLSRAVIALHRAGIIHRDIKPDNVILQPGGGLKLIDLGVARLVHLDHAPVPGVPGTPSYMAPELFDGAEGDERSDLYALGVTIFRAFTQAYPYGEIEPFSHPRFDAPASLIRYRPDLPAWLAHVLDRAVAARPENRFADVIEFLFELEHGADRARPIVKVKKPLYHRNPLLFWKVASALLAIALFFALAHRGGREEPGTTQSPGVKAASPRG